MILYIDCKCDTQKKDNTIKNIIIKKIKVSNIITHVDYCNLFNEKYTGIIIIPHLNIWFLTGMEKISENIAVKKTSVSWELFLNHFYKYRKMLCKNVISFSNPFMCWVSVPVNLSFCK